MAINRTIAGLLASDNFNRANGAPGADWAISGTAAIAANRLQITSNAGSVRNVAMADRAELVHQGKVVIGVGGAGGPTIRHAADHHCYYFQFQENNKIWLFHRNPGYTSVGQFCAFAYAANTPIDYKIHVKNSYQKGWFGETGATSGEAAHAGMNAKNGTAGAHRNSSCEIDDVFIYAGNTVKCSGLPAGWKLRVGARVAVEAAGTATVDLVQDLCPRIKVEVLNAADVVQDELTPGNGVWGGDEYAYTVPIDPPTDLVHDAVEEVITGGNVTASWTAAPVADSYTLAYSTGGGAKTQIAAGIIGTEYDWAAVVAPGIYNLHVRAVTALGMSDWEDSGPLTIRAPIAPTGWTSPEGGLQYPVGDTIPLAPIVPEGTHVDLEWFTAGAWTPIVADLAVGSLPYDWDAPDAVLYSVKTRARAKIGAVVSGWTESPDFAIGTGEMPWILQAILATHPRLCYPLDEAGGSVAYDVSGLGNNGTYVGTHTKQQPGLVPGAGPSVDFAGGGYIACPSTPLNNRSFAIGAFARTPSVAGISPIYHQAFDGNSQVHAYRSGSALALHFNIAETLTSPATLAIDTSYFCVFRYDKVTDLASIWKDGVKIAESAVGPYMSISAVPSAFGAGYNGTNPGGQRMQYLTIWTDGDTLTDAEIADLFSAIATPEPIWIAPEEGALFENIVPLEWEAQEDTEGEYSLDDGATFLPLFALQAGENYDWDTTAIPDTNGVIIRIRSNFGATNTDWVERRISISRVPADPGPVEQRAYGVSARSDFSLRFSFPGEPGPISVSVAELSEPEFAVVVATVNSDMFNMSVDEIWITGLAKNHPYNWRAQQDGEIIAEGQIRTTNFGAFAHQARNLVGGGPIGRHGRVDAPYMTNFSENEVMGGGANSGMPEIVVPFPSGRPFVRYNMANELGGGDQAPLAYRNRITRITGGPGRSVGDPENVGGYTCMIVFRPYRPAADTEFINGVWVPAYRRVAGMYGAWADVDPLDDWVRGRLDIIGSDGSYKRTFGLTFGPVSYDAPNLLFFGVKKEQTYSVTGATLCGHQEYSTEPIGKARWGGMINGGQYAFNEHELMTDTWLLFCGDPNADPPGLGWVSGHGGPWNTAVYPRTDIAMGGNAFQQAGQQDVWYFAGWPRFLDENEMREITAAWRAEEGFEEALIATGATIRLPMDEYARPHIAELEAVIVEE